MFGFTVDSWDATDKAFLAVVSVKVRQVLLTPQSRRSYSLPIFFRYFAILGQLTSIFPCRVVLRQGILFGLDERGSVWIWVQGSCAASASIGMEMFRRVLCASVLLIPLGHKIVDWDAFVLGEITGSREISPRKKVCWQVFG